MTITHVNAANDARYSLWETALLFAQGRMRPNPNESGAVRTEIALPAPDEVVEESTQTSTNRKSTRSADLEGRSHVNSLADE